MNLIITEKSTESTTDPTICLNMIVKNEAHIIEKTLNNICHYIPLSYWVISDTGSEDNTKDIIQNFFDNRGIKGEIIDDEWKDFGHNRSVAIQHAQNKGDYLFIFDADDYINGSFTLPQLTADSYEFKFGCSFTYKRPLLIKNKFQWHYVGVLHEYLSCAEKTSSQIIEGNYYIDSGRSGGRHKDPECYKKDAEILEKAYWEEIANSNIGLARRYAFYCGQSYKDIGNKEKAVQYYKEHVQHNGWDQEKFYSYLQLGNILSSEKNIQEALAAYMSGYQICPRRSETLYELCKYYRLRSQCELANIFYQIGHTIPFDPNALFCNQDVYTYLFDYEFFIIYYYLQNKSIYPIDKIHKIFYKLLNKSYYIENILLNYKFYIKTLISDGKKINLTTDIPEGFVSSTPSIIKYFDLYYINIRLTNVLLNNGSYHLQHKNEVTSNKLIKTTLDFDVINKYDLENNNHLIEIDNPDKLFYGIQDIRLHHFNNEMYFTGVVSTMENNKKVIRMCTGKYDVTDDIVKQTIIKSPNNRDCEKNWVLFNTQETLYCIYEWFPLTIGVIEGDKFNTTKTIQTWPLFRLIRGSSCGYNLLKEREIWFVCHIVSHENVRHYMHVIVILDMDTFVVKQISQPFKFENSPVEYCLGLVVQESDIIMSYSTNDSTSNIMVYDRKELKIFDI